MEFGKFHYAIKLASWLASWFTSWSATCFRLNSITLSRSQTWFPTCRRQVRAISTCRDSSNLVADQFRPYSITLSCSLACLRPARASRELDSVIEFGLRHAHDMHTQVFVQLASSSRTSSRSISIASWSQTCSRAGRKLDSVMEFGLTLH